MRRLIVFLPHIPTLVTPELGSTFRCKPTYKRTGNSTANDSLAGDVSGTTGGAVRGTGRYGCCFNTWPKNIAANRARVNGLRKHLLAHRALFCFPGLLLTSK